MIQSAQKLGGRAFAVVVWTVGLSTIVVLAVLFLFVQSAPGERNWLALSEIMGSYFVMVGIIGGASQAGNAAERLPGVRRFEGQYRGHGMDRRSSDRPFPEEE